MVPSDRDPEHCPRLGPSDRTAAAVSGAFAGLGAARYPKGPWYAAATIFAATGRVELGKAIDGLAFAAMASAVLGAALDTGLRRSRAWALAAVVTLNPVVLSELTSFLVDGIMFSSRWRPPPPGPFDGASPAGGGPGRRDSASIACINAKFTGLVFPPLVAAAGALWRILARRERFRGFAATAAAALLAGTCVWGYNPYVTNTLYRKQPFFPVLGSARYPDTRNPELANEHGETPKNHGGEGPFGPLRLRHLRSAGQSTLPKGA